MLMAAVMPRLLKLPVGSCDSSFMKRCDEPQLAAEPRAVQQRRHPLAERDRLLIERERQKFTIAPEGIRPPQKYRLAKRLPECGPGDTGPRWDEHCAGSPACPPGARCRRSLLRGEKQIQAWE